MHAVSLIAVIICYVLVASVESRWINDDNEIASINAMSNGAWTAGHNARFNNVTDEQARMLLGLTEVPNQVSESAARDVSAAQGLPTSFDSRTKWPKCNMPIRDQSSCGACWSFAASSAFGARMCIQSNGAVKIDMSPQVGIDCNSAQNACSGGTLGGAWEFFKKTGTVAEADYPYVAKKRTCSVRAGTKRYFAASYSRPTTVAAMQTSIYTYGPLQVGMDVYSDLYSYKSGVYRRTSNTLAGGHSVYLVGWGTDSRGVDYWIAVNSWGSSWGQNGVFMIQRGVNMCNIEKGYMPVSGIIAASSIPSSSPTTTKKATTTKAPTLATTTRAITGAPVRNCWTCYPGYVHWYEVEGMAEPSDKCACVKAPSATTTRSPTTTTRAPAPATTTKAPTAAPEHTATPVRNCWTCYPGYVHWYDIEGMAEPSDKCACVKAPSATTRPPTTLAQRTTKAASSTAAPVRNCWTCPAGYIHWFNVAGMAEPADKCACVVNTVVRNCWTCPAGYVHWYDIGMAEPADKCACVPRP